MLTFQYVTLTEIVHFLCLCENEMMMMMMNCNLLIFELVRSLKAYTH